MSSLYSEPGRVTVLTVKGSMFSTAKHKRIFSRSLWIVLLLSSLLCLGWTKSWESIRAAGEKVDAVSAEFVQEKHLPILAKPLVSRGRIAFRRPDALRWEYTAPVRSVLLMTADSVRRFIQTDGGMAEDASVRMQAMHFVMPEISGWLSGRFGDNPLFQAELIDDGTIRMTPHEEAMARFIRSIEVRLSSQPGAIDQVLIIEGEGAFTRMQCTDIQLNPDLPDRLFEEVQ